MERNKSLLTRRNVLKATLAAAGLRAIPLSAAGNTRALVCIYVFGGMDSNNLIVPLVAYDSYAAVRGPLAIARNALLNVTSRIDQAQYGFHPALAEAAELFQQGALAVVANVGPETRPELPDPYLSYFPGGYATPGWAAQMANVTEGDRKSLFVDFPNFSGNGPKTTEMTLIAPGVSATDDLRTAAARVAGAGGGRWGTDFPGTGLGHQLRQAAALIREAGSLGMDRQIFLVGVSSQDWANELATGTALFRELSPAMSAFLSATREMGLAQSVTTYVDTEMSRTLRPNRSGGSDPAWGGHHLVMGGSVLGGTVYGQFPLPSVGGPDDPGQLGILRPSSSKDQYYATLANWFGLPYSDIAAHLPNVRRAARPTLGFMVTG